MDGLRVLLKFFHQRIRTNYLELHSFDANLLKLFAPFAFTGIEEVVVDDLKLDQGPDEGAILHLLARIPSLKEFTYVASTQQSFSAGFFMNEAIRDLKKLDIDRVQMSERQGNFTPVTVSVVDQLTDEALVALRATSLTLDKSLVTAQGLKEFIKQWKRGQREIEDIFLGVQVDQWTSDRNQFFLLLLRNFIVPEPDAPSQRVERENGEFLMVEVTDWPKPCVLLRRFQEEEDEDGDSSDSGTDYFFYFDAMVGRGGD